MEREGMTKGYYLIVVGVVSMILFLGLKAQLTYGQSPMENETSPNNSMMISNNTSESIAEKFIDPESLMLGTPDQAGEKNDTLGQIIGECGIIKPSSEMEEGEEMAECQERILNGTDT
jgi:hypothetical protein